MSKEFIRPHQFAQVEAFLDNELQEELQLNEEQKAELEDLYQGMAYNFKPGNIITGTVIQAGTDGVLLDINYKSYGNIPAYEFSEHELKKLASGSQIEVVLDELDVLGNIIVSYEKAKSIKAWNEILKLFEENQPVEGVVLHKVKGGLSVDIGIPAFLPGSQVDVQRVTDFDAFVGQTVTANIIKVNQKRGNVIISRRKYLYESRAESRKKAIELLEVGQVIQGTVKNITNYGAFIDIGGVDGLLHITDMTWGRVSHPSELIKLGETVTVKILTFDKVNEKISLGIKQLSENPWETLPEEVAAGNKITRRISSIADYGLFIEVQPGVEGLVHISEISWTDRIKDLNRHYEVGQEIETLIVSLDKENRRMSLSIKQLGQNPWDIISEKYEVGQKIKGKISNITEFGIFIQLATGIDGLVHISDFSWTEHIDHPADKYKKEQEVEAVVTSINKQSKKISLGIKQLSENPWKDIEKQYPVGSVVDGEVSKITNFGAFVKLPSGIEGLIHISELPGKSEKVEDFLKIGQKEQFKVIKVSEEDHKLGLRLLSDDQNESSEKEHKPRKKTERSERPDRKDKKHFDNTNAHSGSASKTKSQLQLELEKHATRQKEDADQE